MFAVHMLLNRVILSDQMECVAQPLKETVNRLSDNQRAASLSLFHWPPSLEKNSF